MKPNKHKMAFVTWIIIYPLITGISLVFNTQLMRLPLPIRTLDLSTIIVLLMSYMIMPWATEKLRRWLNC